MVVSKVSTAVEEVKVSGFFKDPFRVLQKDSVANLEGTAVVRVEAPTAVKTHAPVDLVVVLDISSSIGAQYSTTENLSMLHLVKKALKFIITRLDDGDSLAIVSSNNLYATDNSKISSKGPKSADKQVDELVDVDNTGSKSGLKRAVKVLDDRSDNTHQGFIVFLSDGFNNNIESESANEVLDLLQKYPIHTLGLGKAHDPKEMLFIAKESNGTYSSITENLNTKIMEALAICLARLKSVVAVETRVQIRPKQSSLTTDVEISIIDCRGFRLEPERGDIKRGGDILLGVLYAGEVKDFIIHIKFTVKKISGFKKINLLTATVKYKDAQRKQSNATEQCSLGIHVCATYYGKDCTTEPTPFPMVLQEMARSKVLKFMDTFNADLALMKEDAGVSSKRKQGRPATDKGKGDDLMLQKMAGGNLERTWKEFKEADNSLWKEAQRIGLDLGCIIEDDIEAMVSCLRRGSGLACINSWVLSYELQRAAFTGLPETMFLTPAMEEMVQEAQKQSAEDATMPSAEGSSRLAPPGEEFIGKRVVEVLEQIARILEDRVSKAECREQPRNPPEAKTGTLKNPAVPTPGRDKPGGEAKKESTTKEAGASVISNKKHGKSPEVSRRE